MTLPQGRKQTGKNILSPLVSISVISFYIQSLRSRIFFSFKTKLRIMVYMCRVKHWHVGLPTSRSLLCTPRYPRTCLNHPPYSLPLIVPRSPSSQSVIFLPESLQWSPVFYLVKYILLAGYSKSCLLGPFHFSKNITTRAAYPHPHSAQHPPQAD